VIEIVKVDCSDVVVCLQYRTGDKFYRTLNGGAFESCCYFSDRYYLKS